MLVSLTSFQVLKRNPGLGLVLIWDWPSGKKKSFDVGDFLSDALITRTLSFVIIGLACTFHIGVCRQAVQSF